MTSQLATSVDFTLPFYRSRVVVATIQRHRRTGWSSGGLGRPLTTTVWVAAGVVVVAVVLLMSVASCCSHLLDDDQTSITDTDATSSATASSTSRRRRLKNALRHRESRHNWRRLRVAPKSVVVYFIIDYYLAMHLKQVTGCIRYYMLHD